MLSLSRSQKGRDTKEDCHNPAMVANDGAKRSPVMKNENRVHMGRDAGGIIPVPMKNAGNPVSKDLFLSGPAFPLL